MQPVEFTVGTNCFNFHMRCLKVCIHLVVSLPTITKNKFGLMKLEVSHYVNVNIYCVRLFNLFIWSSSFRARRKRCAKCQETKPQYFRLISWINVQFEFQCFLVEIKI